MKHLNTIASAAPNVQLYFTLYIVNVVQGFCPSLCYFHVCRRWLFHIWCFSGCMLQGRSHSQYTLVSDIIHGTRSSANIKESWSTLSLKPRGEVRLAAFLQFTGILVNTSPSPVFTHHKAEQVSRSRGLMWTSLLLWHHQALIIELILNLDFHSLSATMNEVVVDTIIVLTLLKISTSFTVYIKASNA